MKTLLVGMAFWLVCLSSAAAQLNHQVIQQKAEGEIHNAGNTQQQTQATVNNNMVTPAAQSQAIGTVLSVQGDLVTVNQRVVVGTQTMVVKNKFYLQKSTKQPAGFTLTPKANVKINFQNAPDGRRMVNEIGP